MARYYDPATAQFLSRDPLSALTRAPYGYTYDNPLNLTDPTGRRPADFYLFSVGIGPVTKTWAVTAGGNLYFMGGLSLGPAPASFQMFAGWIDPSTVVSGQAHELKNFLTGPAFAATGTYGGGGGLLYGNPGKFGPRDVAALIGVGTPQASLGGDLGFDVLDPLFTISSMWNAVLGDSSPSASCPPADSPTDTDPGYFNTHV